MASTVEYERRHFRFPERLSMLFLCCAVIDVTGLCVGGPNPTLSGFPMVFPSSGESAVHPWRHRNKPSCRCALSLEHMNEAALAITGPTDLFPSHTVQFIRSKPGIEEHCRHVFEKV